MAILILMRAYLLTLIEVKEGSEWLAAELNSFGNSSLTGTLKRPQKATTRQCMTRRAGSGRL